ncbi:4-oxalocrotonate tautomerase DmpI [Terrisporobacter sp.]|uniref:4-oxalocrotonate tautomerase DmpI n=1 Tax=Terrisporobacter sp. TaxID=1965305 RepID=UPI0026085645|nr:4-oxalocrotonate tautomerase DmpI [Terrisporobacter sp.]
MPQIQVEMGPATKEQKKRLIKELTKSASEILGVNESSFYVLIKENSLDNWGVGGKMLSEALKERH